MDVDSSNLALLLGYISRERQYQGCGCMGRCRQAGTLNARADSAAAKVLADQQLLGQAFFFVT